MGNFSRENRAGRHVVIGRRRAQAVADRLGVGLKDARASTGMTQADAAGRAGLSQPRWSQLERGLGANASVETWAIAAASVGEQIAGFLERAPGATPPRDIEHLRRQSALVALSSRGGWTPLPELALDDGPRSRSIDVALMRAASREAAVVEIWDWLSDVGAAWRSFDGKKLALARRLGQHAGWALGGVFIVRATRRNRAIAGELRPLIRARFPADPHDWLRTLTDGAQAMPRGDGWLWSQADGRLAAPRRS
jgi:transcriptional regulator with XRE-family HTH domain